MICCIKLAGSRPEALICSPARHPEDSRNSQTGSFQVATPTAARPAQRDCALGPGFWGLKPDTGDPTGQLAQHNQMLVWRRKYAQFAFCSAFVLSSKLAGPGGLNALPAGIANALETARVENSGVATPTAARPAQRNCALGPELGG